MNKARKRLVKFGMEKEYENWKESLPDKINRPKYGDKFVFTKGVYKGERGRIVLSEPDLYGINTIKRGVWYLSDSDLDSIKII